MTRHWLSQLRGVMRLELKKSLIGRRALPTYFIGLLPVAPLVFSVIVLSMTGLPSELQGETVATMTFMVVFEIILRFVVFLGCIWVLMNLFRGEVIDRSLHYYFLTPIRREVLVAGKYLSGWLTTVIVLGGSTAICFLIVYGYLGHGGTAAGSSLGLLLQYVGVVGLACLGYGAVFMVLGLFLRTLVVPALIIFLLEGVNTFLPSALKKISVIYYLQGLRPLPPTGGPIQIIAEPVSAWVAIPGFILFTALTLVVAALRIRRMEISYGND
jgi:ABC-type transport system involved in multi-copper enzyme maturation permease subunit